MINNNGFINPRNPSVTQCIMKVGVKDLRFPSYSGIISDINRFLRMDFKAHLQSSVFKLSKDLIDSIHEEGIVAYTS